VSLLRGILALALALGFQAGLGRLWPAAHGYVDMMLVPVAWYAFARSQRAGTLVGCVAGLLQDTWFDAGVVGINGFKKTLIGWALGLVGSRFDLNRQPARFLFGASAAVADALLEVPLRRLVDQEGAFPTLPQLAVNATVTGLLVVGAFGSIRRARERRAMRYAA